MSGLLKQFGDKRIKNTEKLGNRVHMLKSLKIITGVRLDRKIVSQVIFFCQCKGIIWRSVEETMAPHSSTLAWKIPWMEGPGRLQSMASLGVGHNWATSLSLFTFVHWRRKWQPTPVFLPGESQGPRSLVGCRLWGPTESDTTEAT